MQKGNDMSSNEPIEPQHHRDADTGDTRDLGDLRVSTGSQSAYLTVEMILYVLAVLGVFITSAIIDEDGPGPGFSAARAWFYVTLLTVGFLVSRGLTKINSRGGNGRVF
jgi:hypothetical protein